MPPIRALVVHPGDDVAVLAEEAPEGASVEAQSSAGVVSLTARQAIPAGHKIAVRDLPAGAPVRKYGEKIGHALRSILAGDHVHLHNLASDRVKA